MASQYLDRDLKDSLTLATSCTTIQVAVPTCFYIWNTKEL